MKTILQTAAFLSVACSVSLFVAGCQTTRAAKLKTEVTDFGIHHTESEYARLKAAAAARGGANARVSPYATQTTRIPARIGVSFGFDYRITGFSPGELVEPKTVIVHPSLPSPITRGPNTTEVSAGRPIRISTEALEGHFVHRFSHESELVPGKWKIQFWNRAVKLLEKEFEVYAP